MATEKEEPAWVVTISKTETFAVFAQTQEDAKQAIKDGDGELIQTQDNIIVRPREGPAQTGGSPARGIGSASSVQPSSETAAIKKFKARTK